MVPDGPGDVLVIVESGGVEVSQSGDPEVFSDRPDGVHSLEITLTDVVVSSGDDGGGNGGYISEKRSDFDQRF